MGQGALSAPDVYDNCHHVLYRPFRFLQPHTISVVPITDTLYCFSYPAIFPLILIYIEALVLKEPNYKRGLLYLLPAFACDISAGLIYATFFPFIFTKHAVQIRKNSLFTLIPAL